jgi:hypothetical protein
LSARVDAFLTARGFRSGERASTAEPQEPNPEPAAADKPEEFVCEDDVRAALRSGRKLFVGEKTILTPSARELGESENVFVQAGWRR